jgi:hypothetical protein
VKEQKLKFSNTRRRFANKNTEYRQTDKLTDKKLGCVSAKTHSLFTLRFKKREKKANKKENTKQTEKKIGKMHVQPTNYEKDSREEKIKKEKDQ